MAVASSAIIAGITAAAAVGGTLVSAKQAHDQKKAMKKAATPAPVYDESAAKKKAANQAAEANRKRVMGETETVQTTALGNTGTTEVRKKTLLGG